ncbi:MAG: hypothetical protein PHX60_10640 [Giesbergeria sp.]|nr:hypothetical protein [Giesbergeria sp.]MDD2610131.1 hypothetical protein [Giesbergeria sp.]
MPAPVPMPFPLHQRLQRLLCITATAWGLNGQRSCRVLARAPRGGFAISY